MRRLVFLALGVATPALAQTTSPPPADPATADPTPQVWSLETGGGYSSRDSGPKGAFALASLNRQLGQSYVRAALTGYRSTLQLADMALPSTYVVGSLGAGGNYHGWVVDGWASYGWQHYGAIATDMGTRLSNAGTGSPYVAAGLRLGF